MISYFMAKESDTGMLLFGLAILMGLGLLYFKMSASQTTLTEFVRDDQGRVIQIIERKN